MCGIAGIYNFRSGRPAAPSELRAMGACLAHRGPDDEGYYEEGPLGLAHKRLTALKFPAAVVSDVARLVELHLRFHGYGGGEWTDSAVRRYVRDAGPLLDRLHVLTRADCTTRNRRKALALARSYDDLEKRIARLSAAEELAAIRPDLDGNAIMQVLEVSPGPVVGRAYRYLLELRLDRGPLDPAEAREELLRWWDDLAGEDTEGL